VETVVVATAIRYSDPEHSRATKLAIGKAAARKAERRLEWRSRLKGTVINEEALRRWYNAAVFPVLSRHKLHAIMDCTGLSKQSAILIRSGRRIPHLLKFLPWPSLPAWSYRTGCCRRLQATAPKSDPERGYDRSHSNTSLWQLPQF
jgi:hypothetical protein